MIDQNIIKSKCPVETREFVHTTVCTKLWLIPYLEITG